MHKERLYYLDWLRVLAFGLLFVFHSARFFDDYGWHLKNEEHSILANILVGFTHGWRMHLIFFISGVGTYFALKSRNGAFIKDRFTRLIVPYLFGIVILVPPQKYYEFLQNNWFTGRFTEFVKGYPMGLMEHHPGATLEWTGYLGLHIWYLAFLFVMTLVYLPLLKAITKPNFLRKSLKFFSRNLIGLFVFILPVILTEVLLRPTLGDYLSWADFFQYSMFFLVGYFFMVFDNYRSLLKKYIYLLLILGTTSSWYILTHYPEINQGETILISIINAGIRITSSYSWVLFFFGLSQRKLNFNSRYLSRLNTGVLPFYILHQTVIIIIGFYVVSTNFSIMTKFLIILTTSLISTILLYQIIKRVNALRLVFGMKRLKRNSEVYRNHPFKSSSGMIFFCPLLTNFVLVKLIKMKEKIIIKMKGHLNETWKDWFDGVEISYEENTTVLICDNKDQAYVHGILNQIRDLNLKLISVNPYKQTK